MALKNAPLTDLLRIFSARFSEDRCIQIASSLTFTTLLSLVPIITVVLTVVSAFPVFESVTGHVQSYVLQNVVPQSVGILADYADQFSANAARLTAFGVVFLGVTALLLMFTIERAFNDIWRVSWRRPLLHRILIYWTVLTIGPLCIGASMSLTSYLLTLSLGLADEAPGIGLLALKFLPVLLTSTAFALMYFTVPNRQVRKRDALLGGVAAGIGFEAMKQGLGLYITHFPTYKLVYGAFAAVPIFLLWIYLSWLIVIGGAELVAILPEWRERAGQSRPVPGSDFFDALQILKALWRAHKTGELVSLSKLHPMVKVRLDHLEAILGTLSGSGWVVRSGPSGWVLSRDAATIKVEDIYRLFVFHTDARVPARHVDQELETLVYDISTRIADNLQMSLEQLFSQAEQGAATEVAVTRIKAV
jgi:membrane protein